MAELLLCGNCGVLIGALYRTDGRVYATINAKIVEGPTAFGAEQPISPKKLAATEKVTRWQDLWFANVVLSQENPQEPGASQRRPPTSSR